MSLASTIPKWIFSHQVSRVRMSRTPRIRHLLYCEVIVYCTGRLLQTGTVLACAWTASGNQTVRKLSQLNFWFGAVLCSMLSSFQFDCLVPVRWFFKVAITPNHIELKTNKAQCNSKPQPTLYVCCANTVYIRKTAIFSASSDPLLRIQDRSNIIQFHFSDCSAFTQNKLQSIDRYNNYQ